MKHFVISVFLVAFASAGFAGEIEDACQTYVSVLDACDVSSDDCEKVGKELEKSLLKKNIDPDVAAHFYKQCVKVCNLPDGKYPAIRDEIEKACLQSLKK